MTLTSEHAHQSDHQPDQQSTLLPMAGLTHGGRSAVTCHLRCGNACAFTAPNSTDTTYFRDIASAALSRRAVLGAGVTGAGIAALAGGLGGALPAAAETLRRNGRGDRITFKTVASPPPALDELTVPSGYKWKPIIRWGDPILKGAPEFNPLTQSAQSQAQQFGYNNDYLDIIVTNDEGTKALLVCNHEYTNENIMFPPGYDKTTMIRAVWEAHGMSVVELERKRPGTVWEYVKRGDLNRRITLTTPFKFDGPATGSSLLRTAGDPTGTTVLGTMNNCSGGTTPWGTVLSGEENFNQYFKATGTDPKEVRYGMSSSQDARGWRDVDPRWDATTSAYANEPNRFGWIIEIDPFKPDATPVKHTAMGRFKHEGANVVINRDGHVVAYMGDDERFDYLYRFVSKKKFREGDRASDRRHNKQLLSEGDLCVARFSGDGLTDGVSDGSGEWIPLTKDGASMVPGYSLEEVLVYTRLAADVVAPTKMDRPEDVQPNPVNGRIYIACTNNTDRGKTGKEGATESNPRPANKDGHIVEIKPRKGDHTAKRFGWDLLLVCGDPATAGTYFGGYAGAVSPISCPDNLAFDSEGDLWIATDGMPSALKYSDGLFKVNLDGKSRGRTRRFLSVPAGAETCGPVVHDRDGSVFVAVQHPGEEGSWTAPQSYFPDYAASGTVAKGDFSGPRPTVVQVVKRR